MKQWSVTLICLSSRGCLEVARFDLDRNFTCAQKDKNNLLHEGILWIFNSVNVLDHETLQTALCEVEAIMNDQSITTIINGLNDIESLTLAQFITCFHSAPLGCLGGRTSGLEEDGDEY